ncbi:hypothetical protein DNX69_08065 [Rhodopseudomonas palustris]|uniref:Uncharacterized protein n=2 Tax=Rhodopseudomonas palustris TaxID=1076 RepID=A0A323UIA7_RHOPL|nr:hypothetical protein DNX69_08065 [Rhodopseudomonas palustris]
MSDGLQSGSGRRASASATPPSVIAGLISKNVKDGGAFWGLLIGGLAYLVLNGRGPYSVTAAVAATDTAAK